MKYFRSQRYTVYTQLPPERNAICQDHLIKPLLWNCDCVEMTPNKDLFSVRWVLWASHGATLSHHKWCWTAELCRRKKEKKNVVLQALWKFSIDWILMKMSVLNTTWQVFFFFPRLYIGTDTEPTSLSDGFLQGSGRPQKTQTCRLFPA